MTFDPAQSYGKNASLNQAISRDGSAVSGKRYIISARTGCATRLGKGDILTIENPSGHQVCDFWAFMYPDLREYMSMAHCHTALDSVLPKTGDTLVTNNRSAILEFLEDTSPGTHDTVIAACDAMRYQQLGARDYHDNCTDNLRMALSAIGLSLPAIPAPFNVWMNIPIRPDSSISWDPPVSSPGDVVRFRALADCVAVMSACPQDMTPVNGVDTAPAELAFSVASNQA